MSDEGPHQADFSAVIAEARRATEAAWGKAPKAEPVNLHRSLLEAFRTARGARINDPVIRAWAKRWKWGDGGALLLGPSGVGKTTGALAIAHRMIQAARGGEREDRHRVESVQFISAYDAAAAPPDDLQRLKLARLVLLDDLGWEDGYRSKIPELIHARAANRFPTVATSGMTAEELAERYGAALVRRIVSVPVQGDVIDTRAARGLR